MLVFSFTKNNLNKYSLLSSTQIAFCYVKYRKTFSKRRTKSQNLNASRLVLQLSSPNPFKAGIKSRMKMKLD